MANCSAMSPAEYTCPFCSLPKERIRGENAHGVWVRDAYPISEGHSLIIPKRHVGSFFDVSDVERSALLGLIDRARAAADAEFNPDGYNIGINDGPAAGQTVPHLGSNPAREAPAFLVPGSGAEAQSATH